MKVASSTWMSVFTRLEDDPDFRKKVEEDGNYYQVHFCQNFISIPAKWHWGHSLTACNVIPPAKSKIAASSPKGGAGGISTNNQKVQNSKFGLFDMGGGGVQIFCVFPNVNVDFKCFSWTRNMLVLNKNLIIVKLKQLVLYCKILKFRTSKKC